MHETRLQLYHHLHNSPENGKKVQYFGESAWTPWDRGLEHFSALMNQNPESPLVEHMSEDHKNEAPNFQMKDSVYQVRPIDRHIEEASNIEEFDGHKILNRRWEWGQNLLPKISVEGNDPGTGVKRKMAKNNLCYC